MKIQQLKLVALVVITTLISSCATIFGGEVTECQRTKPLPGQPQRELRPAALIFDIMGGIVPVFIDFATDAIYKPCVLPNKSADNLRADNSMGNFAKNAEKITEPSAEVEKTDNDEYALLRELKNLENEGVLTKEEFSFEKNVILSKVKSTKNLSMNDVTQLRKAKKLLDDKILTEDEYRKELTRILKSQRFFVGNKVKFRRMGEMQNGVIVDILNNGKVRVEYITVDEINGNRTWDVKLDVSELR